MLERSWIAATGAARLVRFSQIVLHRHSNRRCL